jgi:hypothetical protein
LNTDEVNQLLAVGIFALVAQVFVNREYASFVAKLVQLVQPTQYIIPLTADEVNHLLAVVIFAFVVQVFTFVRLETKYLVQAVKFTFRNQLTITSTLLQAVIVCVVIHIYFHISEEVKYTFQSVQIYKALGALALQEISSQATIVIVIELQLQPQLTFKVVQLKLNQVQSVISSIAQVQPLFLQSNFQEV